MGAGHDHGGGSGRGHSHTQRISAGGRHKGRLLAAFFVLVAFMVVEVVGAASSPARWPCCRTPATCSPTSSASAWRSPPSSSPAAARQRTHRTFGLYRLEILAALANSVLLLGVAVYVLVEALRRFGDPADVLAGPMLVVAIARPRGQPGRVRPPARGRQGVAQRRGRLPRGARRHGRLGRRHRRRHRDPAHRLGVGRPRRRRGHRRSGSSRGRGASPGRPCASSSRPRRRAPTSTPCEADLAAVDGVVDVHDLHVWTLTSDMDVASVHLMVGNGIDHHPCSTRPATMLRERYGIGHATLQVEPEDHRGCDEVGW